MFSMTHAWPHAQAQASFGLVSGFGASGKTHTMEEMLACTCEWMLTRSRAGKPFLTGTCSIQTLVYAYPSGGEWAGGVEDAVVFSGAPALYNNSQSADVRDMLIDLAQAVAERLGQSRFIIFVNGEAQVFARDGAEIPQ